MYSVSLLEQICDQLITRKLMHEGQKKDVLVRASVQEKRIIIDKRQEFREYWSRRKGNYEVNEVEIIASFAFPIPGQEDRVLTEPVIAQAIAEHLGMRFQLIDPLRLDYRLVTQTLPGPFAEKHILIPLSLEDGVLTVAIGNPYDRELIASLPNVTGHEVEVVLSPKSDILKIIMEYYGFRRSVQVAEAEVRKGADVDLTNLEQYVKMKAVAEINATDKPIIQAVWYLFNYAFDQRASDIHIEPKRDMSQVRLRIDGILHKVHMLPKVVHTAVVSRIKMLARMDIAEKRRPQDGRIKTTFRNQEMELRVSSCPTVYGEKVVIRIFDPSILMQDLGNMGLMPKERLQYETLIGNTHGMILITGPTGSGKTTTLYSTLRHLANPAINIATIEDPVEMVCEEFNQLAIQPKIDFGFAEALRTILRQDPDVIMVGEIRDKDTAEQAVQAALTGHLVLATVHTNDAASAVNRLLDLGVLPFLLASVLLGVMAQRLVRTICPSCVTSTFMSEEELLALAIPGGENRRLKIRYGKGCPRCRGTGYQGRTGLFELMVVYPRIAQMIIDRRPSSDIAREARSEGMLTLREYGILKLARGVTTFEEIMRITDEHG